MILSALIWRFWSFNFDNTGFDIESFLYPSPSGLSLLKEAIEKLEGMIDWLYETYGFVKKVRTCRGIAHRAYLDLAKCKKRTDGIIHDAVRKTLVYVKSGFGYLESYMYEDYD